MLETPTQKFSFALDGRRYELDVRTDLTITPATFSSCLMRQSALLAFYAGLYRTADYIVRKLETDIDFLVALKKNTLRSTAPNLKTETAIMDAVKVDPEYQLKVTTLNDEVYTRDMLKEVVSAFRDRTQMLMKIGTKLREGEGIDEAAARELAVSTGPDASIREERFLEASRDSAEKQTQLLKTRRGVRHGD